MVITKYPEHVEMQLKLLDEKIAEVYEQELGYIANENNTAKVMNYQEIERAKKCCYERVKPLLDEKVRLISESCPTYIIKKDTE